MSDVQQETATQSEFTGSETLATKSTEGTPPKGANTSKRKMPSAKKEEGGRVDERVVLLAGLFVLLLSLFLFIAMCSHLFTWAKDQSLAWQNIFIPSELEAGNAIGPVGAALASSFITHGLGLAAFIFPLLCFMFGLRILRVRFSRLKRRVALLFLGMLLSSILLGYIFRSAGGWLGFGFGGKFGYYVSTWLIDFMSPVGAGLMLLFVTVAYLVWLHPSLTHKFLALLQFSGRGIVERLNLSLTRNPVDQITYDTPTTAGAEMTPEGRDPSQGATDAVTLQSPIAASEEIEKERDEEGDKEGDEKLENATAPIEQQLVEGEQAASLGDSAEQSSKIPFEVTRPSSKIEENTERESLTFTEEVFSDSLQENENTGGERLPIEEATFEVYRPPQEEGGALEQAAALEPYDPTLELSHYQLPPLTLLDRHDDNQELVSEEELNDNNRRITKTLAEFDIGIEKIMATIGPTVTLYEIIPAPGIRVSKIESLEKDLALRLEAIGVRIFTRKGAIGIEVPNQKPTTVSMLSVLESKTFQKHTGALPLALGRTISNEAFVVDLEKMPHLLVAGATGQGKSVGLNAIIASILFKKHPSQVKLVMVDPKKVEFSLYAKIENYFLAKLPEEEAIITDSEKVIYTLNSLCAEMDHRLNMLKEAQVRNITEYNEKFVARHLNPEKGHAYMPRIVVIIDEFADLMMTSSADVVPPLMRLAQLGRAPGIHLVIATQRPTTDILVGKIKANIPARIAFRVTSGTDSRTILDMPGADRLIGRGDMLVKTDSLNVDRVQCAFLSTEEVARITDYIGQQQSYFSAWLLPDVEAASGAKNDTYSGGSGEFDPLFDEVKSFVIAEGTCSITSIQRKFTIGFPRAARIVDQLEQAGVVSSKKGTKEREVLL